MSSTEQEEKSPLLHVRVGLPGGTVHDFELAPTATLSDVANQVILAENLDQNAVRIRLICAGKLFSDFSLQVRDIVGDGDFLHCAVSQRREESSESSGRSDHQTEAEYPETQLVFEAIDTYRGVSVVISDHSATSSSRLAEAGFSEEEIRFILRHFHVLQRQAAARRDRHRNGDIEEGGRQAESNDNNDSEDFIARVRRPRSEPGYMMSSSVEGSNGDFLMGCIFGYLLGIIVLVLLLDNSATRRWRVGLVAGVATNCAFGVLRTGLHLNGPFPTT